MKLLTRISWSYILFSFVAFVISGIIFSNVVRSIFYSQIDQTLVTERRLIEEQINYSDSIPDFRMIFSHLIAVTVNNTPVRKVKSYINDTVLYDKTSHALLPYRQLVVKKNDLNQRGYFIRILASLEDTDTLIRTIIIALTALFLALLAFLILVNYTISKNVWRSFYRTLDSLSRYDISRTTPLVLHRTRIREFRQLNNTLDKMSRKLQQDYRTLKEFNENASHEIQTPLAIIKSKLELLVQNESLSEEQLKIIKSVFEATNRMSRLNQGLLLISKIDNNQFPDAEKVSLQQLLERSLEHLGELICLRNLKVRKQFNGNPEPVMNKTLAEILISNLLSNAIKHNIENGEISITLDDQFLTISNTGNQLSVPPEELFERFRKSDRGTESPGLGLSIVKKILQIYNFPVSYSVNDRVHQLTITFRASKDKT